MDKLGFDNQKYLELQSAHIRERIRQFGNKLYLEFGGKLFDDHHASRVLPGFEPDSKIRMLASIRDEVEIVVAICAGDIEKNKVRGDLGITYDSDVLRLIDAFRGMDLYVGSVVVTQYDRQPAADVVPVVHGKWISFLDGDHIMPERYYRCSRCGRVESRRQPHCHCGAKMDGAE